ncbi:hypothetical protein [Novosphingobium malaysiense]|uniref:hypothetical protein n=1 Tax=Novosphingobium malaysiense TaxID=1348853 RepID=UPI00068D69C3|nr:hypothetical protein [Novosphingobium malaysiense]
MITGPAERQDHEIAERPFVDGDDALRQDMHLGLQICRANSLSLTRLQLALNNGNRRRVLEAVDRLHELDTQIGRLLKKLPVTEGDDPDLQAICRHVDEQSMAVAFEKLALVSEVSGPHMVTSSRDWDDHFDAADPEETGSDQRGRGIPAGSNRYHKVIGLVLALAAFMALVIVAGFGLAG